MQRPARSSKIRAGSFEFVCHVVRYCPYLFRQSLQLELEMIVAPGRRAGGFLHGGSVHSRFLAAAKAARAAARTPAASRGRP